MADRAPVYCHAPRSRWRCCLRIGVLKTPVRHESEVVGGLVCDCPHAIELQYFRRGERSIIYAHLVELVVSMIGDTIIGSDE
jgi:hypothetical protein